MKRGLGATFDRPRSSVLIDILFKIQRMVGTTESDPQQSPVRQLSNLLLYHFTVLRTFREVLLICSPYPEPHLEPLLWQN